MRCFLIIVGSFCISSSSFMGLSTIAFMCCGLCNIIFVEITVHFCRNHLDWNNIVLGKDVAFLIGTTALSLTIAQPRVEICLLKSGGLLMFFLSRVLNLHLVEVDLLSKFQGRGLYNIYNLNTFICLEACQGTKVASV
ncbi:hypothetical protein L6452_14582 [Arctium lappa]|uniref:Uncharacterized protein n=1 Tax=Arctium lappa TaxID=4217 RepID=A0ACB9CLF1_ARCLA|nr:hypothetical protein L6452_14582 [Arctium lappa]